MPKHLSTYVEAHTLQCNCQTLCPFTPLSINKTSLHYHKTNLTKAYLASVVKSLENQLINQYFNKSNHLEMAPHNCVQRGKAIRFVG